MQRNKKRNALTILLVPHSERAPISLQVPNWLVPLLTVVLVALVVASTAFAYRYCSLQRRVRALQAEQSAERVRQREMRATILSQQDEVRNLSTQVEEFKAELLSVRRLSDEIRDILGLPTATPTSSASQPAVVPGDPGRSESWVWGDGASEAPIGGHVALQPSSRSMRVAVERGHELIDMQVAASAEVQALQALRDLVLERLSRIDKSDRRDWETLQQSLRQWAAAPHLWPVHPHPISSEYGYREFRGVRSFHYGIDLAVWTGTKVRATKDGTVTVASWLPGYGWAVEIAHEAGYSTLYGHNSALLVKVGDRVKAGDVIALSGSSGWSTGPHVHYEIRLWGTPVDPLRYIDEG